MRRPSTTVLLVFLLVVIVGGSNFVGVRFSNRELPPFLGAGIRFAAAALLLLALSRAMRLPLARGRALVAFLGSVALGDERFRWSGVLGGLIAIAGVTVIFADQVHDVPVLAVVALTLQAIGIA